MKHRNKPMWCDWRHGYTGSPPLSYEQGQRWQQQWQYMTQWNYHGLDFEYSGPPDTSINGSPGSVTQKFYPIFATPNCEDTEDRQLGLALKPWDFDSTDGTPLIKWYPDYTVPGTSHTLWTVGATDVASESSYGDQSHFNVIECYDDMTYTPPGATETTMMAGCLEVQQIFIAAVAIWHQPRTLTVSQVLPQIGHFQHGQVIRGMSSTATDDDEKTLGGLCHLVGDGSRAYESIDTLTRRTLFQWGHPVSQWWSGAIQRVNKNIFGNYSFRFNLRNPLEKTSGNQACYPAMVVQGGDDDCVIRYTTTTDGAGTDTWSYTFPGAGHANPTLIQPSDGGTNDIDCDLTDTCTCTIDITKPEGSAEVNIHTVALFEGASWSD